MNRRAFLRLAAIGPVASKVLLSRAGEEEKRRLLFVGTQTVDGSTSKGIYAYHWDPLSGELHAAGLAAESENLLAELPQLEEAHI